MQRQSTLSLPQAPLAPPAPTAWERSCENILEELEELCTLHRRLCEELAQVEYDQLHSPLSIAERAAVRNVYETAISRCVLRRDICREALET